MLVRPIALTLCDIVSLTRQNKLVALILAGVAVLLLVSAYFSAAELEAHTFDLLYAAIKSYLSKKTTGIAYQGVLQWLLSNGAFYVFRYCARIVLAAAYDLGRDVVFSLSLLAGVLATSSAALAAMHAGGSPLTGQAAAWALLFAAFLGWFWSRYMSPHNDHHSSFDFDVGAALARLRNV